MRLSREGARIIPAVGQPSGSRRVLRSKRVMPKPDPGGRDGARLRDEVERGVGRLLGGGGRASAAAALSGASGEDDEEDAEGLAG